MSAQTDLTILVNDIKATALDLPASITQVLDHYYRVRVDINALGDVNNADPRIVTSSALAALDAGKDPVTDKATKDALTRYQIGSDFGSRLLTAAAQAAIVAIRAQDAEFVEALDQVFLPIVDQLRTSHEVLAIHGIQIGLRDPLGRLANLGGTAVTARLAWTSALARLKPVRRMYESVVGHAPNRTDFGDVSGQLREDILANPGWWQARDDWGDLFWGLLDSVSWTPGLASRDESTERLARLESERPKPATVEAKEARHVQMVDLGAIS